MTRRHLRRALAGLAAAVLALLLTPAAPATAQSTIGVEPSEVVHSETARLGDTTLTVSFTDWPIVADRSLDFLFKPDGGIQDRTGRLRMVSPSGGTSAIGWFDEQADWLELPRYVHDRDVWGLDIVALPEEGTWRFELVVTGPEGTSRGTLPIQVGPRPGPPITLSWIVGMLPWAVLAPVLAYGWIRTRPARLREIRDWTGEAAPAPPATVPRNPDPARRAP